MQLPLAFLDAAAIEEVPIAVWRDVFEVIGWPGSLATKSSVLTHEDVLHSLEQDAPTDNLLQALETVHTLGTERGREAIVSAMADRGVRMDGLPKETGQREFALRFYLAQRSDASLADVFARAQLDVQEGSDQHRYHEFTGKETRNITNLRAKEETLRNEILRYCRESDLGEHVQVQAFEDDGTYVFNILRSHRTQQPLAVVPGHAARATIRFRPVHGDILRYEAFTGRLRVAARAGSIVEYYRGLLGRVLFDDELFFGGEPVYSLRVLQERGRAAFENHHVFGVGRIWMTECLWERGDRNLHQIRSGDCFRSIEELRLPFQEGELLQAKLKFEVVRKSTRPVTVNIRVPSRIEVSQKTHEHLAEKLLRAIGVRSSTRMPESVTLWLSYPWRQPVAVWRTIFGAEMDALVQAGVLNPIQLDSVPHPEHPDAGRVLRPQPVSDGDFYGVSDVDEIPSRSLSATDLDGLELIPEKFRLHLRSVLGITHGGVSWDGQDLLHLGVVELCGQRIYFTYAIRQPAAGIGDRTRSHAEGAHPVMLIPPSQTDACELARVNLETTLPTRNQVIRGAIQACGLETNMLAIHSAPDGARLVVDTRFKKVWLDGVEISGLQADSHPFKLIEMMARASGPLSHGEVCTKLSAGRQDDTTTARQAKLAAKKIITKAMAEAGRPFVEDPFPTAGHGFYRCALPAYIQ